MKYRRNQKKINYKKRKHKKVELIIIPKNEYKICVDVCLSGTIPYLKQRGFNVFELKKGLFNTQIHKLLNENDIKYFFTKTYNDYEFLYPKNYRTFKIAVNRPDELMADIFDWLVANIEKLHEKNVDIIFNGSLRYMGCKK